MAHVFVLMEGRKVWNDIFISDLTKRRYQYKANDGRWMYNQPNVREIKLLDISVPEQNIPILLNDLAPFAGGTSKLKGVANLAAMLLRKMTRLRSIHDLNPGEKRKTRIKNYILESLKLKEKPKLQPYNIASGEVRNHWVNVVPIGWGEDVKAGLDERPMLPYGGELL